MKRTAKLVYPFVWGLVKGDQEVDDPSKSACRKALSIARQVRGTIINLCGDSPNCPNQTSSISNLMAAYLSTITQDIELVAMHMDQVRNVYGRDEEIFALIGYILEERYTKAHVTFVTSNNWNCMRIFILSLRMKRYLKKEGVILKVRIRMCGDGAPWTLRYIKDEFVATCGELLRPLIHKFTNWELRIYKKVSPFWR